MWHQNEFSDEKKDIPKSGKKLQSDTLKLIDVSQPLQIWMDTVDR